MTRTKHPYYETWKSMRARCNTKSNKDYPIYGGRGIKVCKRWDEFWDFVKDMGVKPSPEYTIERIDNDGNYQPSNCKWATRKEQARNASKNRLLTYRGKTRTFSAWSEDTGIKWTTLRRRIESGWPPKKSIETPVRSYSTSKA